MRKYLVARPEHKYPLFVNTFYESNTGNLSMKRKFNIYIYIYIYIYISKIFSVVGVCSNNNYVQPRCSSGQNSWLQTQRFRVRFPVLSGFLRSCGSGTEHTRPLKDNERLTDRKNSGSGL
jgi:hypothetical protein